MSRHLSPDELLSAAEGGVARHEHLAACPSCRTEVEALAAVMRDVASMPVHEPSPLFWERFSARVREACHQEAAASRKSTAGTADQKIGGYMTIAACMKVGGSIWKRWRLVVPALAAMLLLVVAGLFVARRSSAPMTTPGLTVAAVVPAPAHADDSAAADESWRAFAAVASEADPAGTMFSTPAPGLADGAVLQMSDEERGELIRLLEDELARGRTRGRG